jgi:hypothetical protein
MANAIADAIRDAGLNLNPAVEGNNVRVPVPKPGKETRDATLKLVAKVSEAVKNRIRRVRQAAMDKLKKVEGEQCATAVMRARAGADPAGGADHTRRSTSVAVPVALTVPCVGPVRRRRRRRVHGRDVPADEGGAGADNGRHGGGRQAGGEEEGGGGGVVGGHASCPARMSWMQLPPCPICAAQCCPVMVCCAPHCDREPADRRPHEAPASL